MKYEQEARERQGMENRIKELEDMFYSMQLDFAECAKHNISPCFFCANDETCDGRPETCYFKWQSHN